MRKWICIFMLVLLLGSCQNTTFVSSVPSYPVWLDLTHAWYPHFVPAGDTPIPGQGMTFTTLRTDWGDRIGYAGIVVYITIFEQYEAWDLCCPHCVERKPMELDGGLCRCQKCGEEYILFDGTGVPSQGISKEPLRRYTCIYQKAGANSKVIIRD